MTAFATEPVVPGTAAAPPVLQVRVDPRTRLLIEAPIARTLLRLAVPNIIVMVAQASVGLIEMYFIGQLGTDALAGVTLVFPILMLMHMMSGGAMGGGIASAIARALGAGRRGDADDRFRRRQGPCRRAVDARQCSRAGQVRGMVCGDAAAVGPAARGVGVGSFHHHAAVHPGDDPRQRCRRYPVPPESACDAVELSVRPRLSVCAH